MWGLENLKDVLDVLFVPIAVGLVTALWPTFAARKRRSNFEHLIRRELDEASPRPIALDEHQYGVVPWHLHLDRRFLHEEIIQHPVENADFVLSLDPELAYHLSQMWIEFNKAKGETDRREGPSADHAVQFLWHLGKTVQFLDSKARRVDRRAARGCLTTKIRAPWEELLKSKYPATDFSESGTAVRRDPSRIGHRTAQPVQQIELVRAEVNEVATARDPRIHPPPPAARLDRHFGA